ncbi:MAG: SDR family NAD(P)-dependent oxidoreductase [Deltaproteobacteria bacterium]|nr:SDR family NAD(P)-dependent oxidoreductase [Deltaproteobacteria bacterium]
MRVLVTGGAGFIGSHTVDELIKKGDEVTILDNLEKPVHLSGRPEYLHKDARFIHGDVRNRDDFSKALEGAEAVFHFAAYQDYLTDFSKFFSVNAVGTALLYELIVEKRLPVKKVIVASSQAVYGEGRCVCKCMTAAAFIYPDIRKEEDLRAGKWEIPCPRCGGELTPLEADETTVNPQNQYAVSKYSQEMAALNIGKRYSIPTVILRYSIVQGPRQSFYNAYSGACRVFALSLYLGKSPPVYEDGAQLRDYVNIEDVVRANMLVYIDKRADYGVFNVGGGRRHTVLELYRAVAEALKSTVEPRLGNRYRFGDTRHIISDISRLRALGWEPLNTIEKSAAAYIGWLKEQGGIDDMLDYAKENMERLGVVRRAAV